MRSIISGDRELNTFPPKSPSTHITILKRPPPLPDNPTFSNTLFSTDICIEDCIINNVNYRRGTEQCINMQVQENMDQDTGSIEVEKEQYTYVNAESAQEEQFITKPQDIEFENVHKDKLVCKNPK